MERDDGDGAQRRGGGLALPACVVLLAVLAGALALQNRALKRDAPAAQRTADGALMERDEAARLWPVVEAVDAEGRAFLLDPWASGRAAVVFLSSDGCDACAEAAPGWAQIAMACAERGLDVDVLALRLAPEPAGGELAEGLPEDAPLRIATIERVRGGSERLLSSVPGFPATCVIDAEGALDAAFLGAPDGEAVERIVARIESLGAR